MLLLAAACSWNPQSAQAVEVAPRISDREIIESLSALKEGQKALEKRLDERSEAMEERFNERFEAMEARFDERSEAMEKRLDERFEAMEARFNQRFETMETQFLTRFEAMDQRSRDSFVAVGNQFDAVGHRFEAMDKRLEDIHWVLGWVLNLLSILIVGVLSILGFVIWDRKTTLGPVEKRVDTLESAEEQLRQHLEFQHEGGSRLTRLMRALQERSKTDRDLAIALRSYSLL
uniref:Uncharacterized protein n=1 Tax=Candidatus Kentrum sp. UNK TaxID=2126344 RepID=A0A451AU62_9GAMM|nr:MAG: hypothetical protein BECKUNK1418G_GA0071005_101523 [Candidatus Kentron sp. UNK]VFK69580.1 MAG: hypothetical protein BECKUNK1418H_GA0071006_101615 [Candidatus Kentron sp. UNK]